MKVALTGHSKNLGKYLFSNLPFEIKGYSRSNGWDIADIVSILDDSEDCAIFINNAYNGTNRQSEVLLEWFNRYYENPDKHIINIGSRAAEWCRFRGERHDYSLHKANLRETAFQLQRADDRKCKITHISPGYIQAYPDEEMNKDVIGLGEYINLITLIIQTPTVEFQDILLRGWH